MQGEHKIPRHYTLHSSYTNQKDKLDILSAGVLCTLVGFVNIYLYNIGIYNISEVYAHAWNLWVVNSAVWKVAL